MANIRKRKGSKGALIRPTDTADESPYRNYPVFSLYQMRSPHCIDDCEADDKKLFADALWKRSKMTWTDLTVTRKGGLGSEPIPRKAMKSPIPENITPEVNLIAFRFSGKKAMVGYREGQIFHIVWLDHSFSVYDHGS